MWCIRTYLNSNNNKVLAATLLDEYTNQFQTFGLNDLKGVIATGKVNNLRLDIYNRIQMINMIHHKRNYYTVTYCGDIEIRHFCIITGYDYTLGTVNWIASKCGSTEEFFNVCGSTLSEIEGTLGENIRFYNAFVDKDNRLNVYVNKNTYRRMGKISIQNLEQQSNDWEIDFTVDKNNNIIVNSIEHKRGKAEATIPNGINKIIRFNGNVNSLTLPDSVTSLAPNCFSEVDDLYSIRLGRGLKEIPKNCFYGCDNLKSVKFSGSEQIIKAGAFEDCIRLQDVIVTKANMIEERAFSDSGIVSVKLLDCIEIKKDAFSLCNNLNKVTLNDGLKWIGKRAFSNCKKITTLSIPTSVDFIEEDAFINCTGLREVRISTRTDLHDRAFMKRCNLIVERR